MVTEATKNFYGAEAVSRAKHPEKLDQAYERLEKAVSTPNPSLGDKMMQLAAKSENEAFSE